MNNLQYSARFKGLQVHTLLWMLTSILPTKQSIKV